MINIKVRFKILKHTNVLEIAKYGDMQGSLREILLGIKYNKLKLFVRVEQAKGSNQSYVNILIPVKLKMEG